MNEGPSQPPWERHDAFPEKPPDHDYGYVASGVLVPCSREQLIRICSRGDIPGVSLVWHPEAPRVVPVAQVAFLKAALKQRTQKKLRTQLWIGLVSLAYFGFIATTAWHFGQLFILLLIIMAFVGILPVIQSLRGLKDLQAIPAEDFAEETSYSRYNAWIGSRSLYFTWTLLALIYVIGAVELGRGVQTAIDRAGLVKTAVWQGEWWRLLTGPLLHGSELHFALNAFALLGLGRLTEALASRYHLAVAFLFSALSGSGLSLFLSPQNISVGSSGGLMGLVGFLIILGYFRRKHLPTGFVSMLTLNVVLVVLIGVVAWSIVDNAAHLGGFLGGLASGMMLIPRRNQTLPLQPTRALMAAGWLSLGMTVAAAMWAVWRILD
jgi:membrane associated rhomboid family serine protease